MAYRVKNQFEKYKIDPSNAQSIRVWDDAELYKSSYLVQSSKNPLAMQNSTEQLLRTNSSNLRSVSASENFAKKQLELPDFFHYDVNNLYRTTYTDMSTKEPKLHLSPYISRYSGHVPGMNSENPFGTTFTQLAKKQSEDFNNRRFGREIKKMYKE